MSRAIGLCLLLAGLLYPFAVYAGIGHFSPRQLALFLGGLWLMRALTSRQALGQRAITGAALLFCVLLGVFDSPVLLRWYPVLISLLLLGLFGLSLKYGPPLIERLARLQEPQLPDNAVAYTRQVTKVWCGFFLGNGLIAAALTLWAPLSWWVAYTGLIAYALMGALFAGEWLIRQRVRGRA